MVTYKGTSTASSIQPKTTTTATRPHLRHRSTAPDPSRLAPEDALVFPYRAGEGASGPLRTASDVRRKRDKVWDGSGIKRRKVWKKLLWVKQSCKKLNDTLM